MSFKSINPYNQELLEIFPMDTDSEVSVKLERASQAYASWRKTSLTQRKDLFLTLARLLRDQVDSHARIISSEMGKVLKEAQSEVEKCAWVCEYYAEQGESFLAQEEMASDAQLSYVRYDPIGAILGIMPWNFPYWQFFRYAVPTLLTGNVTLLKPAPNVPQCAKAIAGLFQEAGFPEGVMQNLFVYVSQVPDVIESAVVQGVTLTGSTRAGAAVAAIAGRNIKRSVLELGGSDAFIVLADADLEKAAQMAVASRMLNAGQSCIAAKRWLVEASVVDDFATRVQKQVHALIQGDPMAPETTTGPLARKDLAQGLYTQLDQSLSAGATLLAGGAYEDCNFQPTFIRDVGPGMSAFDEETFGPLGTLIEVAIVWKRRFLWRISRPMD